MYGNAPIKHDGVPRGAGLKSVNGRNPVARSRRALGRFRDTLILTCFLKLLPHVRAAVLRRLDLSAQEADCTPNEPAVDLETPTGTSA